jgi:hypothetical protein
MAATNKCLARKNKSPRECQATKSGNIPAGSREEPAMPDFDFTVNIVARVRVQAADENAARKAVPTVLAAPGTTEIRLANENNIAMGHDATVTDISFSVESIKQL